MCLLAAQHLDTDWVCLNCDNLDRRQYYLGVKMGELMRSQKDTEDVRKRVLLVRHHSMPDREERVKLAASQYLEAQIAVINRVSTIDGRITPRNSDSLELHSEDICLDETDDNEEAPPAALQPVVLPPVEEPLAETDSSRSISTSSGFPPSQSHFE